MNYKYRKPLPGYKLGNTSIDFFDTKQAVEDISQARMQNYLIPQES